MTTVEKRELIDRINEALIKLGYNPFLEIRREIDQKAVEMGFTYLPGPIPLMLRPRLLTMHHMAELREYAKNLWQDAVRLEGL